MAKEYEVLAEQIAKLSSELIAVRARLDRIENHYTVDGHPSRSWFTDELAGFTDRVDAEVNRIKAGSDVFASLSRAALSAIDVKAVE